MMTTTIRSSISVKPFLVLIEKSPEIRLVTASRCRHHSKDGTVRSTATGYMAGSRPKTVKVLTYCYIEGSTADLKETIKVFRCKLQGQMHSAIHQPNDALA